MKKPVIKYAVLEYLAAAGIVGLTVTIPAVFAGVMAIGIFSKIAKGTSYKNGRVTDPYFYRVTSQLKKEGLIIEHGEGKGKKIELSKKGKIFLKKLKAKTPQKEVWDKKWRILIFDVYETNREKRNRLRNEIQEYGFIQLQRSVWVYPYRCETFIHLLKTDLSFGKNVQYIVAEKIEDDGYLKKHFGLGR